MDRAANQEDNGRDLPIVRTIALKLKILIFDEATGGIFDGLLMVITALGEAPAAFLLLGAFSMREQGLDFLSAGWQRNWRKKGGKVQ